ncbi:MAG: hypothetical protein PHE17_17645 [Thiothrix sp.]|uniref:hypothetical protein n=1 Tax=Thiothrix sp. TaxID=1032 RepID=UPI0026396FFA|nr:hypothetical protein [Thiothrix sp.]MDD5394845.1 hypothetical protein [Thiothrix sp.]
MKPEPWNAEPTALDETIVVADHEWAVHRESGLRVRKLRGQTVLKQRWNQWLFEVTDGLFSAVFLYDQWPTYHQPIRKGLAIFSELFPVGDARVGHWYEVNGLDEVPLVEITSLYPLQGQYAGHLYTLDIGQLGDCLTA